jgi:hypothetical protein
LTTRWTVLLSVMMDVWQQYRIFTAYHNNNKPWPQGGQYYYQWWWMSGNNTVYLLYIMKVSTRVSRHQVTRQTEILHQVCFSEEYLENAPKYSSSLHWYLKIVVNVNSPIGWKNKEYLNNDLSLVEIPYTVYIRVVRIRNGIQNGYETPWPFEISLYENNKINWLLQDSYQ